MQWKWLIIRPTIIICSSDASWLHSFSQMLPNCIFKWYLFCGAPLYKGFALFVLVYFMFVFFLYLIFAFVHVVFWPPLPPDGSYLLHQTGPKLFFDPHKHPEMWNIGQGEDWEIKGRIYLEPNKIFRWQLVLAFMIVIRKEMLDNDTQIRNLWKNCFKHIVFWKLRSHEKNSGAGTKFHLWEYSILRW